MSKKPPKPHDRERSPRFKERDKPAKPAADSEPEPELVDQERINPELPDVVKCAIADSIMAFAAMEMTAERLLWDFTGLSYDDGRLITAFDVTRKFDLLKKLTERYNRPPHPSEQATMEMWTAVRQLIEVRNRIVHGVWGMLDGSIPVAISYRLPTDIGEVTSEAFPLPRLDAIIRQCFRVKGHLEILSQSLRASPPKRPEPRRRPTTNPPQSPTPDKK